MNIHQPRDGRMLNNNLQTPLSGIRVYTAGTQNSFWFGSWWEREREEETRKRIWRDRKRMFLVWRRSKLKNSENLKWPTGGVRGRGIYLWVILLRVSLDRRQQQRSAPGKTITAKKWHRAITARESWKENTRGSTQGTVKGSLTHSQPQTVRTNEEDDEQTKFSGSGGPYFWVVTAQRILRILSPIMQML